MGEEVELVSDDDGLAVIGSPAAVDRFLGAVGLRELAVALHLDTLGRALEIGSDLAQTAAQMVEKSGRYVKLTKESAERMTEQGFMPTKIKGISHAMFGDPGDIGKWVQVEDTAGALLTNPAMLTGAAGILAQFARQTEAQELKELLQRIDGKLDDVRRRQRDEVLAALDRAIESVDEALVIREHGGDTRTAWEKVVSESGTIALTRANALRALEALADKVDGITRVGTLATAIAEVEKDTALWLTVLARTFQLDNEYKILELDRVRESVPDKLEYHRLALAETMAKRQKIVLEKTQHLIDRMEAASDFARSNVVLHAGAARRVIDSVNQVGESVEQFNRPLGIGVTRNDQSTTRWRDAVRDPQQLRTAAKDAGPKVAVVALTIIAAAVALAMKDDESESSTASE